MEFGTRWGQNLSIFSNLRTLYEPTHYHRKIIGFDTFSGFVDVAPQDGTSVYAQRAMCAPRRATRSSWSAFCPRRRRSSPCAQEEV